MSTIAYLDLAVIHELVARQRLSHRSSALGTGASTGDLAMSHRQRAFALAHRAGV